MDSPLQRCPVCGSGDIAAIPGYVVSLRGARQQVFSCTACRGAFKNPFPSDEELAKLYADYGSHEIPGRKAERRSGIGWEGRFNGSCAPLGKTGDLLDFGCGNGGFIEHAVVRGWRAIGVEPARDTIEFPSTEVGEMVVADLDEIPCDHCFDVVTAWAVVEHLKRPTETCERLAALLKPGGLFVIQTPDFLSGASRKHGPRWRNMHRGDHLVLFSRPSLKWLTKTLGLEEEGSAASGVPTMMAGGDDDLVDSWKRRLKHLVLRSRWLKAVAKKVLGMAGQLDDIEWYMRKPRDGEKPRAIRGEASP